RLLGLRWRCSKQYGSVAHEQTGPLHVKSAFQLVRPGILLRIGAGAAIAPRPYFFDGFIAARSLSASEPKLSDCAWSCCSAYSRTSRFSPASRTALRLNWIRR